LDQVINGERLLDIGDLAGIESHIIAFRPTN